MSLLKTGAKQSAEGKAVHSPSKNESTEKAVEAAMREARIITPGIQALFGFQLVAALDARFSKLVPSIKSFYRGKESVWLADLIQGRYLSVLELGEAL